MSVASATAAPVLPDHVKKPNEEEFKKELAEVNANIEKLQKQFDAVKEKINKTPQKNDNARREEIKAELNEIRDKQAALKKTRKAVYEQLDAINDSIRNKVGSIKGFQTKIPFKTTEEVDARIAELESKIEAGVRIVEEKKMLQEISLLKRNRLSVEDVDGQQAAINKEREIYGELKKNIDDSEAKKLSDRYEELDAEFKLLYADQSKQREARNQLYDERNRLKALLDEEYSKMRTMRDEHRKNNDEYYTFVRQLREYKREQEQLRKEQEENEKRQEAAKQELELAALPAFESEIALCDNLAIFLESFVSSGADKKSQQEPSVNAAADAFDGMVIKKRDEEDFFVGKSKKKQQQKQKDPKDKKSDSLKLPLATMEAFFDIKVTVPTKISEIPATLTKLKERKEYYIAEQPKATELNKKKAEEKIKAMQKEEEEQKKAEAEAAAAAAAAAAAEKQETPTEEKKEE
ncbi:unnamed protein product [Mucor circinelloides]|uniref:Nuclear segregation protein Bfr1 n=1 Tax=Mucor circinelloides f. circinelloides (strain 1006PhL) TaxID=1220926 RepID=S2JJC8_MUCC1|nr:hypothetical protein HMPREF1544_03136 [Mucor circinelloides 1006PhL]